MFVHALCEDGTIAIDAAKRSMATKTVLSRRGENLQLEWINRSRHRQCPRRREDDGRRRTVSLQRLELPVCILQTFRPLKTPC